MNRNVTVILFDESLLLFLTETATNKSCKNQIIPHCEYIITVVSSAFAPGILDDKCRCHLKTNNGQIVFIAPFISI